MTLLFYDERFLDHKTSISHPERPARVQTSYQRLVEKGLAPQCQQAEPGPVDDELLRLVHSEKQIQRAEKTCLEGGGFLDGDTPVSADSFEVAKLAAGCAVRAVESVLRARHTNAFCLMRPPGHHATHNRSMGFCLFNNIALAARHAIEHFHLQRILIVDWDVHHGNGTQAIFYEDPRVMFFSSHRHPFYPGTGRKDETGSGRGLGYTVNHPVTFGTPAKEFRKGFTSLLSRAADKIRPELVLVSAGFDAHARDPIGSLGLETEDFEELFNLVHQIAETHAHGALVSLLEGGYDLAALAECVELHVSQLLRAANRN